MCVKTSRQRQKKQQQHQVGEEGCAIDLSQTEEVSDVTVRAGRPKPSGGRPAASRGRPAGSTNRASDVTATALAGATAAAAAPPLSRGRSSGSGRTGSRLKLQLRRPRTAAGPPSVRLPTDTAGGAWGTSSVSAIDSDELSDSSDDDFDVVSNKAAQSARARNEDNDDDDDDEEEEEQEDDDDAWQPQTRKRVGARAKHDRNRAATTVARSSDDSETDYESSADVVAGSATLDPAAVMALLREAAGCTANETDTDGGALTLTLGELERACAKFETFQGDQTVEESEQEARSFPLPVASLTVEADVPCAPCYCLASWLKEICQVLNRHCLRRLKICLPLTDVTQVIDSLELKPHRTSWSTATRLSSLLAKCLFDPL